MLYSSKPSKQWSPILSVLVFSSSLFYMLFSMTAYFMFQAGSFPNALVWIAGYLATRNYVSSNHFHYSH